MKTKHILLLYLSLLRTESFAHEQIVHQAITVHAAASALTGSPATAFARFMDVISADKPLKEATNAVVKGSFNEDFGPNEDSVGGHRSLNHFYDPTKNPPLGLTDQPWPFWTTSIGRDSFTWASKRDSPGLDSYIETGRSNTWSWQNARNQEWLGLTASNRSDRQAALDSMFTAVGQVMHLLEDTSQPQHVRNEQHLDMFPGTSNSTPWRSPIEDYGGENVADLNYQHAMLDWKGVGFTKLEDFWNRHLYDGRTSSALTAEANGGQKLGLAEFSSGNYLGDRHLYPEYFKRGGIEYYAYPSRDTSTDYKQVKAHPRIETFKLRDKNKTEVNGIYVKKTGDGILVDHHARMNYLGGKGLYVTKGATPFCTIKDDKVLGDYHSKLIPKAVEYSAGLIDYFFRGKLETTVTPNNTNGGYDLVIKNVSGQDLNGGTFQVLYDDPDDIRTALASSGNDGTFVVSSWDTQSGSLPNNGTLNASLVPPPNTNVKKYTLVYKGTIGISSGLQRDAVDAEIAVAAEMLRLPMEWTKLSWTTHVYQLDGGTASGSASGDSCSGEAAATFFGNYSTGSFSALGSMYYTGPATNCIITGTASSMVSDVDPYVTAGSFWDVSYNGSSLASGSLENGSISFTIPESAGAYIEIFFGVGARATFFALVGGEHAEAESSGTVSVVP